LAGNRLTASLFAFTEEASAAQQQQQQASGNKGNDLGSSVASSLCVLFFSRIFDRFAKQFSVRNFAARILIAPEKTIDLIATIPSPDNVTFQENRSARVL
jgi:hypothetical protein